MFFTLTFFYPSEDQIDLTRLCQYGIELFHQIDVLFGHFLQFASHDVIEVSLPLTGHIELVGAVGTVVFIVVCLDEVGIFVQLLLAVTSIPVAAANSGVDGDAAILRYEAIPESGGTPYSSGPAWAGSECRTG